MDSYKNFYFVAAFFPILSGNKSQTSLALENPIWKSIYFVVFYSWS